MLSATSAETTERAKKQAEAILRQRHRIAEGDEDDFMVRSQAEFQAMQDAIFGALSVLLIGIAAVDGVLHGLELGLAADDEVVLAVLADAVPLPQDLLRLGAWRARWSPPQWR